MRELIGTEERLIVVVGGYGSGKTEVCVNLALQLAGSGRRAQIADLDIVNPYFRCREARALMAEHGIRVVSPSGSQAFADLPIVMREVAGMLRPVGETISILDVGGDDVGARVLSSLRPGVRDYELWQVVNSKRPFSRTVRGCLQVRESLERASRLSVTGLVANSHLIDETTPETVLEGWQLAQEVAARADLPVRCVAVMEQLADAPQLAEIDAPLLRMRRYMLPPWRLPEPDSAAAPARHPAPIGKPAPVHFQGDRDGQNRD